MKLCNNCNNIEHESSKYCSNCGSSDFKTNDNERKTNYSYYTIQNSANYYNDGKNLKKKKMLSMLGVLALIFIILIFVTAFKLVHDAKINKNMDVTYSSKDDITYSAGTIKDGFYSNRWADIKFTMSEGWSEASQDQYKSYEDEITTCDFYAKNTDGSLIAVVFVDLSNEDDLNYSEYDLMKELSVGVLSRFTKFKISDNLYQLIGNQLYLYSDISGNINNSNICITSYIRKNENRAIVINITSNSAEQNHKIAESIESVE